MAVLLLFTDNDTTINTELFHTHLTGMTTVTMFGLAAVADDGYLCFNDRRPLQQCIARAVAKTKNDKRVALQSHFAFRSDVEKTKNGLLYRFSFSFLY